MPKAPKSRSLSQLAYRTLSKAEGDPAKEKCCKGSTCTCAKQYGLDHACPCAWCICGPFLKGKK
jgi:hypothetical protein